MFIKAYEWGAVVLTALVLAFALLFLQTGRVWAQEVEQGVGVLCDESAQMRRYLQLYKEDPRAALAETNAEFTPTSCVPARVLFIRGESGDEERGWVVTSILVLAVYSPHGWQRIAPHVYWTAFKVEGRDA